MSDICFMDTLRAWRVVCSAYYFIKAGSEWRWRILIKYRYRA